MRTTVILTFLAAFINISQDAICQTSDYQPRKIYRAGNITKVVEKAFDYELWARYKSSVPGKVAELNLARKRHVRNLVENSALISDDSLQSFVDSIVKRIEDHNQLSEKNRVVFIVRDPGVNAFCLGGGIFMVNIGLLARIDSESLLAFTLAHEIAHDELSHSVSRMEWLAENSFVRKQKSRMEAVTDGRAGVRDLQLFRELNYAYYERNRQSEFQADSLGLIFYRNAGYNGQDASRTLKMLEDGNKPKYPFEEEALAALDAQDYPFAEHWLNPRLKVFSKKLENEFLFNLDSMSSHPAIERRMEILDRAYEVGQTEEIPSFITFDEIVRTAEFETVESAYFRKRYDICLMQALMLWQKYPGHPYLVRRIGGIFLQLSLSKDDLTVDNYVPVFVAGYSAEQKVMNSFLHNITSDETKNILYHFITNPRHFNESNKDHYYIRWKICELTYRHDEAREIERRFRSKFGSGIGAHSYRLETTRKLNIFDFYRQWGWVFL